MHRGFRYRLEPTAAQAETLTQWVGVVRLVYNLALEQRRDFWRQYRRETGRPLTWVAQSREVTDLRRAYDWIGAVPRSALEQALRDLDKAYSAFFRGVSRYPRPRAKGLNDSLRLQADESVRVRRLNARWSAVRIPNLGWVKYRDTRLLRGRLLHVTLAKTADGWFVAFGQECEAAAVDTLGAGVGIDRGIAATITLSTGDQASAPATLRELEHRTDRQRRVVSRRKRGSKRAATAKRRLARMQARAARIRRDWVHRQTTAIARRFGLVAIEKLNVAAMTAAANGAGVRQKAGLNRAILRQGWGVFEAALAYKLEERGGVLVRIDPAYTSQTCSACGVVDAGSRKSQAVFHCVACDHRDNADVNAAKEILRRSTASMGAEGSRWRPVEAPIQAAA